MHFIQSNVTHAIFEGQQEYFQIECPVFTSGVWPKQSQWRDDGNCGVYKPLQHQPGGRLHSHWGTWNHVAQV